MTWRLNNSTMSQNSTSNVGHRRYPKQDPNPIAQHLLNFNKSIKREVSLYTILKVSNILKHLKGTFWLLPQHMVMRKSWMYHTCLEMMQIAKNIFNRINILCTVF